jgi:hypothetical protein
VQQSGGYYFWLEDFVEEDKEDLHFWSLIAFSSSHSSSDISAGTNNTPVLQFSGKSTVLSLFINTTEIFFFPKEREVLFNLDSLPL